MILRHGIRVAIVGETNVGKSSLLNRITNTEKVIVSEFHGTTRDSIDCDINIDGIPVQITDTAGIRKSSDPVENIGIQKAKEALGKAHLVLIVTDVQKPSIPEEVYHLVDPEQNCIWIVNKIDLWSNQEELEFKSGQPESCLISAKYEKGIQALKNEIKHLIFENRMDDQEIMSVPNTRHKNNLESARTYLLEARNKIKNDHPEELVAMDVRDAATHIQEIIGSRVDLDLVEIIFRDFCVGK